MRMDARLARLIDLGAEGSVATDLLPAFAACLSLDEACDALVNLVDATPKVRRAVLTRVLYLARERADRTRIGDLSRKLLIARITARGRRRRIDALLSTLFPFLSGVEKRDILTVWMSDDSRDTKSRWLKAVSGNVDLFDVDEVVEYWKTNHDWTAAKLLAYLAPPEVLTQELADLIDHCDEGWIIAKAMLRATTVSEDLMERVRERFPATYAYVCAKTHRLLTHETALDLFYRTKPGDFSGGRGLAAWSIGYLGMWDTLEEIQARSSEALSSA